MNITPFPTLSPATIDAINVIGQWLAQDDFSGEVPYQADCVILAGNAVMPTIDAACKIARDQQIPLLISGGIGHSTTFLYSAIAQHPHYNTIRTTGRAEATILADIAHQFWHIPHEKIWIEDQSTNCGENARFSPALAGVPCVRFCESVQVRNAPTSRRASPQRRPAAGGIPWPRRKNRRSVFTISRPTKCMAICTAARISLPRPRPQSPSALRPDQTRSGPPPAPRHRNSCPSSGR